MQAFRVGWQAFWLTLLLCGTTGCASVDYHQTKSESFALTNTSETPLGKEATHLLERQLPDQSGFIPLLDGVQALAYRLALIESATRSIDIQYYLIKNDPIGRIFTAAIYKAAERGVRIRINLDDIFTQGYDEALLALNAHPNIEIRLFNPWSARKFRLGNVFSFAQLNRRLHNKSLTADNQFTIIGGRNIAGEYFAARQDLNFMDADVLATGPLVHEVSTMFDAYWNNPLSVPVNQLAKSKKEPKQVVDALLLAAQRDTNNFSGTPYEKAVIDDIELLVNETDSLFVWAPYQFIYDAPEKAFAKASPDTKTIVAPILDILGEAKQELVIVSPYFVPLKSGVKEIGSLIDAGVQVKIITNSLASNNHTLVHAGYTHYRKDVLKTGAKLYETHYKAPVSGSERIYLENAGATLHTKAFFVDGKLVFVGSFNFDPRSANLNTEMGVVIYSELLATKHLENLQQKLDEYTYEVVLNNEKKVRWIDRSNATVQQFSKEPDTGFWRRAVCRFLSILPIRSQL